jgi:tyrosyl-tRNA synthetase
MTSAAEQHRVLVRGATAVLPDGALLAQLERGRPLRVKAGFDPTAPDLHLGHFVLLEKLREFQAFGHEICLIVGDFTAMIGDPSGRNTTRPALDQEQIRANADRYANQVFRVLDPGRTRVAFNSAWLGQLSAAGLIGIASRYSVARMLERDDFTRRHGERRPIGLHEFLYPLLQGYDSVAVGADVELGGTDQTFNLLVGRHLQESYGHRPQSILTVPILEGTDGVQKMSKSLGNAITLSEPPDDMFGKLMSVSDTLMWRYYELLGRRDPEDLATLRAAVQGGANPRDLKLTLAEELVARFHGEAAGAAARSAFLSRFSARHAPTTAPEVALEVTSEDGILIGHAVAHAGLVRSTSEALRLVHQGGIRLNGVVIRDPRLLVRPGTRSLLEVGRRRAIHLVVRPAPSGA